MGLRVIEQQGAAHNTNTADKKSFPEGDKLLAVITALLVLVSFLQWKAMRDALNDARESNERAQRAYVVIAHQLDSIKVGPVIFRFHIKNCGQTPAYELTSTFGWKTFPGINAQWPASEPFVAVRADHASSGTIGPGMEITMDTRLQHLDDRDAFFAAQAAANRKEITLFYYGTITYKDAFRRELRTTDYCFVHVAGQEASNGAVYRAHNEAT